MEEEKIIFQSLIENLLMVSQFFSHSRKEKFLDDRVIKIDWTLLGVALNAQSRFNLTTVPGFRQPVRASGGEASPPPKPSAVVMA